MASFPTGTPPTSAFVSWSQQGRWAATRRATSDCEIDLAFAEPFSDAPRACAASVGAELLRLLGHRGVEAVGEVLLSELPEAEQLTLGELAGITGEDRVKIIVVQTETAVVTGLFHHVAHEPRVAEGIDAADEIPVFRVGFVQVILGGRRQ